MNFHIEPDFARENLIYIERENGGRVITGRGAYKSDFASFGGEY